MIEIEISAGEAFDRLSILGIKSDKIKDPTKKFRATRDFRELYGMISARIPETMYEEEKTKPWGVYQELRKVNLELWELEDDVRKLLREIDHHHWCRKTIWYAFLDFAQLGGHVPKLNDQRYELKQKIDKLCGDTGEVKDYV